MNINYDNSKAGSKWYSNIATIYTCKIFPQERRPYLATECDSLQEAEKWRHQVDSVL